MSKFKKKKKEFCSQYSCPPRYRFYATVLFYGNNNERNVLKIENPKLPVATEVKKLEHKSLVSTIYVGKAKDPKYGTGYNQIQLNDKIATADDVPQFILKEREDVSEGEIPYMTTSIKADVKSSVGVITDIRLKLRDVNALKLSYSSTQGAEDN